MDHIKGKQGVVGVQVLEGDCRDVLAGMEPGLVDAVVTDPPYELKFMGRKWDGTGVAYDMEMWQQVLRALKPGGHLLAFGGSRTYHRMAVAIEDAGFEIRDQIQWLYGQGFPKSLDVSKAIDTAAGAERVVVGERVRLGDKRSYKGDEFGKHGIYSKANGSLPLTTPATPDAKHWSGWGTALKPAHEPIVLARKPLAERTIAAQVLTTGTGAINVDGCRIGNGADAKGRWPANVILDPEAGAMLGDASRFFYCAKASKAERGESNNHPTVKPLALMAYLVRLITPPGGVVLDPFAGSGTTGLAAAAEGFDAILIEQEPEYIEIIHRRLGMVS